MKTGDIYIKKTTKQEYKIEVVDKGETVIYHQVGSTDKKLASSQGFLCAFEAKPVEEVKDLGFWERRAEIKRQAEMDNQPIDNWDVMDNY